MTNGVYRERVRVFLNFFMENTSTITNTMKKKPMQTRVFFFLGRKL